MNQIAKWIFSQWPKENEALGIFSESELLEVLKNPDPNEFTLIALQQESAIGTISLINEDLPQCDLTPWVGDFYVHPDHRSQGVGKILLEHILSLLEHQTLYINCVPSLVTYYESDLAFTD